MAIVIEAVNLSKRYEVTRKAAGLSGALRSLVHPKRVDVVALDGIDLTVSEGEIVGYIGVNGAGKSTTIKLLSGILRPSSGSVRVLDRDPHRARVANARDIGAVFGQRSQLWWDLALIESLDMLAKIYDIERGRYRQLLEEFDAILDLAPLMHVPVRTLSLGQRMRAELAAALIHEPKVLYLDEPTVGLDLKAKDRIRQFILRQRQTRGTAVVLTTHDLGDIEALCPRIVVLDCGKIIYDGPLDAIQGRLGTRRIIKFETSEHASRVRAPAGVEVVSQSDQQLVVSFHRGLTTASRVASDIMSQVDVTDFTVTETDLSAVVRAIYDGKLAHFDAGSPA